MIVDTASKRRSSNSDDNLIPLINVVFLMLIFFMVAGHIEASDGVDISPPTSRNEADINLDKLKVVVSSDSKTFVEGKELSAQELTDRLNHYIDMFSEAENNKAVVELKADNQLTAEALQEVLMLIKSAGINHISLVTQSLE